jgi:hypothetical protein
MKLLWPLVQHQCQEQKGTKVKNRVVMIELAHLIVVPNSKGAWLKQISRVQDRVRLGAVLTT